MICSMTTFARSAVSATDWSCSMELKSVNGRYCDVYMHIPRSMSPLEDRIKKVIKQSLKRGRIDFYIQFEGSSSKTGPSFFPDVSAARSWLMAVEQLAEELRLASGATITNLLACVPNVIVMNQETDDETDLWKQIEGPLNEILAMAREVGEREGKVLAEDMEKRLFVIENYLREISSRRNIHLGAAQNALKERVKKLLEQVGIDESRLAHEAAIMADKLDITEEIVRAGSHMERFKHYLQTSEPVGRRLDFLTQELLREFNTMASKSCDSVISQAVVEVKGELEKIREQVQNIV